MGKRLYKNYLKIKGRMTTAPTNGTENDEQDLDFNQNYGKFVVDDLKSVGNEVVNSNKHKSCIENAVDGKKKGYKDENCLCNIVIEKENGCRDLRKDDRNIVVEQRITESLIKNCDRNDTVNNTNFLCNTDMLKTIHATQLTSELAQNSMLIQNNLDHTCIKTKNTKTERMNHKKTHIIMPESMNNTRKTNDTVKHVQKKAESYLETNEEIECDINNKQKQVVDQSMKGAPDDLLNETCENCDSLNKNLDTSTIITTDEMNTSGHEFINSEHEKLSEKTHTTILDNTTQEKICKNTNNTHKEFYNQSINDETTENMNKNRLVNETIKDEKILDTNIKDDQQTIKVTENETDHKFVLDCFINSLNYKIMQKRNPEEKELRSKYYNYIHESMRDTLHNAHVSAEEGIECGMSDYDIAAKRQRKLIKHWCIYVRRNIIPEMIDCTFSDAKIFLYEKVLNRTLVEIENKIYGNEFDLDYYSVFAREGVKSRAKSENYEKWIKLPREYKIALSHACGEEYTYDDSDDEVETKVTETCDYTLIENNETEIAKNVLSNSNERNLIEKTQVLKQGKFSAKECAEEITENISDEEEASEKTENTVVEEDSVEKNKGIYGKEFTKMENENYHVEENTAAKNDNNSIQDKRLDSFDTTKLNDIISAEKNLINKQVDESLINTGDATQTTEEKFADDLDASEQDVYGKEDALDYVDSTEFHEETLQESKNNNIDEYVPMERKNTGELYEEEFNSSPNNNQLKIKDAKPPKPAKYAEPTMHTESNYVRGHTAIHDNDKLVDLYPAIPTNIENVFQQLDLKYVEKSPSKRFVKLNYLLGHGSQKLVFRALDLLEGRDVAWNVLERRKLKNNLTFYDPHELTEINHPNIIKVYEVFLTKDHLILVTEYMTGGSLKSFLAHYSPSAFVIRRWCSQIAYAIRYLHSLNIMHRDIKCDNVFIDSSTGLVKLGDLGVCKYADNMRHTMVGTPEFMARELLDGAGYGPTIDIYAFGMTVLEMVSGNYPYSECETPNQVFVRVTSGIPPQSIFFINNACLRSLIIECIGFNNNRLTADELVNHHFFNSKDNIDYNGEYNHEIPYDSNSQYLPYKISDCGNQVPTFVNAFSGCDSCLTKYGEKYNFPNYCFQQNTHIGLLAFSGTMLLCQIYIKEIERFIRFKFEVTVDTISQLAADFIDIGVYEKDDYMTLKGFIESEFNKIKAILSTRSDLNKYLALWAGADPSIQTEITRELPNFGLGINKHIGHEDSDELWTETAEEINQMVQEFKDTVGVFPHEFVSDTKQIKKKNKKLILIDKVNKACENPDSVETKDEEKSNNNLYNLEEEMISSENIDEGENTIDENINKEKHISNMATKTEIISRDEIGQCTINDRKSEVIDTDTLINKNKIVEQENINKTVNNAIMVENSKNNKIKYRNASKRFVLDSLYEEANSGCRKCAANGNQKTTTYKEESIKGKAVKNTTQLNGNNGQTHTNKFNGNNSKNEVNTENNFTNNAADIQNTNSINSQTTNYTNTQTTNSINTQNTNNATNQILNSANTQILNSANSQILNNAVNIQNTNFTNNETQTNAESTNNQKQLNGENHNDTNNGNIRTLHSNLSSTSLNIIDFPDKVYADDLEITEFVKETVMITNRDINIYKDWYKILKHNEIVCVADLKVLVEEDWDKLGLPIFPCRAMKNMLYGDDKQVIKEKDLIKNDNEIVLIEDYMNVEEFITQLGIVLNKNVEDWIHKIKKHDIRTVKELRVLTESDWDRLGISVIGQRILKNVLLKQGKIVKNNRVV